MASRTSAYLSWLPTGGSRQKLFFDVVPSEVQTGESDITEHPVEQGPSFTDNIRAKLDSVTLDVFVSNEPLYDINDRGASLKSKTLDVKTYDPPLAPTPGALFSAIGGALSRAFNSAPVTTQAYVLTFDQEFDAVSETQAILDILQKGGQLIDVYTTTKEYTNMVLQKWTGTRDPSVGNGGKFNLQFRQIRIVEVKLVNAPVPTEKRAKPALKKGPQGPEPTPPAKPKSVARALLGNLFKP